MQEDIKKYEKVILQLREEFLKNNPDLESNKNDNNNNKKIFKSNRNPENIGSFSNVDLYKIRLRCKYEIEKMVPLDSEEQSLIRCIKFGRKRDFRHFICSFTGNIDLEKIMASYNEFIKSSEVFRSVYMYKDIYNETKVVYNHKNTTFPVSDVSELSEKELLNTLENVLTTEARREYNPESDSVLKMQGFIVGKDKLIVIVSIYPYFNVSMNVRQILNTIFKDLKLQSDISYENDDKKFDRHDANTNKNSLIYWKKLIGSIEGSPLKIPGQLNKDDKVYEKHSVYKVIDKNLDQKVREYCLKNNVSVKSVMLMTWADLLGDYNSKKEVILAVLQKGKNMNLFPIKVCGKDDFKQTSKEIEAQLINCVKNSFCKLDDLEKEFNINSEDYFQAVHHFIEFNQISSLDDLNQSSGFVMERNIGDVNNNLRLNYHIFDEEIGINYIYNSGCFYDTTIDRLHYIFSSTLEKIVLSERKKFNKNEYISEDDTDEEKIKKLHIAQKALYIQQTGLFNDRTVEELMELAEKARLVQYSINDVLVEAEQSVCEMAILADGKLEESKADFNGMVKSIRLLKSGNIFAVESLLDNNIINCSYTAVCNEIKIVWINREDLIPFLNQKADNWRAILDVVNANANQMKKLWITV